MLNTRFKRMEMALFDSKLLDSQLQRIYDNTLRIVKTHGSDLVLSLYKNMRFGKMLRSRLALSIVENDQAYDLCAIIELIQAASLLHDDVIDQSETRRGAPSVSYVFGNKRGIMLGDILYSSAFYELCALSPKIAKSISLSVCKLSLGELEDVALEERFNDNQDRYLKMIELKSASLIAASAQSAALLLNDDSLDDMDFYDYGLNLGIAFQIIDDILDITQSAEELGKPAFSDYASGKTTLPYIYLYEALDSKGDSKLKEWLLGLFRKSMDTKDKEKLLNLMHELNALQRAKDKALHYGNLALQKSRKINNKKLESFVTSMIERSF